VGCPAWDLIQNDIKRSVGGLEGVRSTKVRFEWQHEWSREDIVPEARLIAREHGYCI
jgi:metal-sulfur cluster biosynthetic enzyme